MSSPTALKRGATSSPLRSDERRWSKSACESSSSVAESWPEDSASEHMGESSVSSVSDDSRPPSAADKVWQMSGSGGEGWLLRCSSPLATSPHLQGHSGQSMEESRTGSSLGSSTVYGHESYDVATASQAHDVEATQMAGESVSKVYSETSSTHALESGPRRRSREPKAGSLLSRNLLKGRGSRQHSYAGSDSSSVRSVASSLKRAPRCAGLQIDFTDPDQAASAETALDDESAIGERRTVERCWFQCEAVLEGFR